MAGSISTQQELSEIMRVMTKVVIERVLDAEMDVHLDRVPGVTQLDITAAQSAA